MYWCPWGMNNLAINFRLHCQELPTFRCRLDSGSNLGIKRRVSVKITPLGTHERDIAMLDNKHKVVYKQFVAFFPTNYKHYQLN